MGIIMNPQSLSDWLVPLLCGIYYFFYIYVLFGCVTRYSEMFRSHLS